jgi:hypothetical protein
MLDSISLFLEEPPLLAGAALASLLKLPFGKYDYVRLTNLQELASPRASTLPEVFQRKLTAYSKQYFEEVTEQNRLADMIRYNFSHGIQVSLRDLFRHPLLDFVPAELLPSPEASAPLFQQWPLLEGDLGLIPELKRLEEILQALLARVAEMQRQRKLEVYLQSPSDPTRAIKVQSIEFDPVREVDWRVEFQEKKELESEFTLVSFRKQPLHFYRSFAVEATEGVILVHPWRQELSLLQEKLSSVSEDLFLRDQKMPSFQLLGELEAKALLKYLRTRAIPVKITGESRTLAAQQSRMEIRLEPSGEFYIQHEARVFKQKNLVRKGWTSRTALYLQTLSKGLCYLLGVEPKDIASRQQSKRDWDLKLLKHLGILHHVFLETLFFHFEGTLSDGRTVHREDLFSLLQHDMQKILISGVGESFVRAEPLSELCSRPVLACFDEFVKNILVSAQASEAFYSEQGEVILEGVVDREFRLLLHLFLGAVPSSSEAALEFFKKAKKPLLSRIFSGDPKSDLQGVLGSLHFPTLARESALPKALERLQPLIPFGFALFLNDRPLQDLDEGDLKIDFVLRSDADARFFNWFELSPKFFLHGEEVDPESILKLGAGGVVEYDGKLFAVPKEQWPSLQRLEDFWHKLQKGKVETSKRDHEELVFKLPRHQALELLALRASGIPLRGDETWQKMCRFYDTLGTETRDLVLATSTTAELKPYQRAGVSWLLELYSLRFGALLADDMGLGKTLQALSFLDILREQGQLGQVLIVVPSSLVFNWMDEIQKFTPQLPVAVFTKDQDNRLGKRLLGKEDLVVITTYGLLLEHGNFLNQFPWNVAIFDEAQNLKNITTKRTSAARSLHCQFKIALTGTPMENHYGEFYSLMDLLVPGCLGDLEDFRRSFVNTEMVTREEIKDLKLKMKPLFLRRTKREILDQLPPKQETKVSIAFEEEQKQIYRDVALSYNNRVQETMEIQGNASIQLQMLTALLRLRQVCSDPSALPHIHYNKVPPKLETLRDSVREIVESGESALVFTQFLQTLHHTVDLLKEAGVPVFSLHGGVPVKQRQKMLSEFSQCEGGAVLVMTLKTGGVGLNLTKASYIFHLEPWWNPAVENQATDRAHRLGQNKAVQVFKYIMHESLEEKIEDLQMRKDRKFEALFSTAETETELSSGQSGLTKQDFDHLLGLR